MEIKGVCPDPFLTFEEANLPSDIMLEVRKSWLRCSVPLLACLCSQAQSDAVCVCLNYVINSSSFHCNYALDIFVLQVACG